MYTHDNKKRFPEIFSEIFLPLFIKCKQLTVLIFITYALI